MNGRKLLALCLCLFAVINLWLTFRFHPLPSTEKDNEIVEGVKHVHVQFAAPRDARLSKEAVAPKEIISLSPESKVTSKSHPTPLSSSSPTTTVMTAVVQARNRPDPNAVVQGLPLCNSCYDYNPKLVTVYFDQFTRMNNYFGTFATDEKDMPKTCNLPDGAKCIPQHTDNKADVIFKSIQAYAAPLRYCYPQIVAILNSEAVVSGRMNQADIRVDHHLSSGALYNEACGIPAELLATRTPPDPKTRKGTGLFLSNCGVAWRSNFIKGLMDHMYVYSYGRCFHNQKEPSDRNMYLGTYAKHASLHRTVVTFENTIQADYISEKIMLVYESGAIPVYWGPPEIYLWVPGNHSFIDASKFAGPKELAAYLKRVDEDDDLFRYHTTNLDVEKTRRMKEKYCENKICRTCRVAYEMKKKRYENGC